MTCQEGIFMASKQQRQTEGQAGDSTQYVHQIWLAGLGAFSKAGDEGMKFFDQLVERGHEVEERNRKASDQKSQQMADKAVRAWNDMADRASEGWDRVGKTVEEQVSRALGSVGVATSQDIERLTAQVKELNKHLQALGKNKK
jgi:poly(hydroxyalkanoate) granule-associated protein